MYFPYGWPRTFCAVPTASQYQPVGGAEDCSAGVNGTHANDEIVYLHLDSEYCIVLGKGVIQVWTGGKNRVRLGQVERAADSIEQLGTNIAGVWSSSRHQLAVLSSKGFLLLYGTRITKDTVLYTQSPVARGAPIELKGVTVYLQYCIPVEGADEHLCPELVADSRTIIVAYGDAVLQAYSWQGKFRGKAGPLPVSLHYTHSSLFPSPSVPADAGFGLTSLSSTPSYPLPPLAHAGSYPRQAGVGSRRTSESVLTAGSATDAGVGTMVVRSMDYAGRIKVVMLVLDDGRIGMCRVPDNGLHPLESWSFSHWVCGAGSGALTARVCESGQLVAVGMANGSVALYPLHSSRGGVRQAPVRVLSLKDWGHGEEVTGGVARMRWSPDGQALAVGFSRCGQVVWSPSGCRLMCTLRQGAAGHRGTGDMGPSRTTSSDRQTLSSLLGTGDDANDAVAGRAAEGAPGQQATDHEAGVCALAWGPYGYQLLVAEAGDAAHFRELSFAKSLGGSHRVLHSGGANKAGGGVLGALALQQQEEAVHVLQADDRLLLIVEEAGAAREEGAEPGLIVQHLLVPLHYIACNYPLVKAAVSADGMDVAVAGTHGVALYSRRSQRWRVFGDISQERQIRVQALVWLPRVIVVCAHVDGVAGGGGGPAEHTAAQLLLYPRYHLDNSSLLARYPLAQAPIAMDAVGSYLLLACEPLDITLLKVTLEGQLIPTASPMATLTVVRQLGIISMGQPLRDIALIAPQATEEEANAGVGSEVEPHLCVLQRCGGTFSVLDLKQGSEQTLASDVECFWLPAAPVWRGGDELSVAAAPAAPPLRNSVSFTRTLRCPSPEAAAVAAAAAPSPRSASPGGLRPGVTDTSLEASTTAATRRGGHDGSSGGRGLRESKGGSSSSSGDVEMPWWTYGARGMQLWFPSTLHSGTGPTGPSLSSLRLHRSASNASNVSAGSGREGGRDSRRTEEVTSPGGAGGGGYGASLISHSGGLSSAFGSAGGGLSSLASAGTQGQATDPELEFDKEVYPIGISFSEVAIIGITQRVVRGHSAAVAVAGGGSEGSVHGGGLGGGYSSGGIFSHDSAPCFHPLPESQPVLPCLLRRLLQQDRAAEALALARRHSGAPHFPRSLEWLLFTTLESDAEAFSQRLSKRKAMGRPLPLTPDMVPLVTAAARLLKHFPKHFPDIAVRVARKTDSVLWPVLFQAVGPPSGLLLSLMSAGSLQTAACCLIIVDSIEGTATAHDQALRLIRAALGEGLYDLCAELVRYLLPPGEAEAILNQVYGPKLAELQRAAGRGEAAGAANGGSAAQVAATTAPMAEESSWGVLSWFWGSSTSADAATNAAGTPSANGTAGRPSRHASQGGSYFGAGDGALSPNAASMESSLAVMAQAWEVIGRHAFLLLDQGRLRELARLGSAFAHMGAGLRGLLAAATVDSISFRAPSTMAIVSALAVTSAELAPSSPGDLDSEADARFLLAVTEEHPGCEAWAVALAVVVRDETALRVFMQRRPDTWQGFLGIVSRDGSFKQHAAVLKALDQQAGRAQAPPALRALGRAGQAT